MSEGGARTRTSEIWLLVATFVVAVAGLVYELIAATVSSYLLGDSVRQFSFVIGIFLTAMGVGAWVSRFVGDPVRGFVSAQLALGIIGGFSAPLVFFSYAYLGSVSTPLYSALIAIGILSGMEIPLIARVLKEIGAPEFRFENVLTADYIGALAASLLFPLLIIPHLGLMAASLAFGCVNLGVAGLSLWLFRTRFGTGIWVVFGSVLTLSVGALALSERMVSVVDANLYEDDVILTERTPYQAITVTRFQDRTRLFLDGAIQFDTLDEHRYHEALVHPMLGLAPRRANILILGGGDGMAVREVLRHRDVAQITLVDLDPRMTELFRENPMLAALNSGALMDVRVRIVNEDAWSFVGRDSDVYDVVILDLPDPKSLALSKLYSVEFYGQLVERLSATGVLVTQAGSPVFARQAYWSIVETLRATRNPLSPGEGLHVIPYHVYVPSFGDWGFVAATKRPLSAREPELPSGLTFLTAEVWSASQTFSADDGPLPVAPNSIRDHRLVGYYQAGWDYWFR